MKYTIVTTDAVKSINTIIKCIKAQKDPQDKSIDTWGIQKSNDGEELLVHTPDQWGNIGCLSLTPNDTNGKIDVEFYYWEEYPAKDINGDENKYILGRFTELMLVHFDGQYTSINIRP